MEGRKVSVGGVNFQVVDHPHMGETVIFLHYGGGNLKMWAGVVPFFKGKYRTVLVDLRGHGKSDKPASGYTIDGMAGDVVGLMDALGIGQAHLVGSSMGAEIELSLAANHPARALSLTLEGALFSEFGPYGIWQGDETAFREHAKERLAQTQAAYAKAYPSLDALVAESREKFSKYGWWCEAFEAVLRYGAIQDAAGKYHTGWEAGAREYTQDYLFKRFEEYYPKVKCPVLMMPDVYPGQDAREKEIMQGFRDLLDDVRVTPVPEWVHPFGWLLDPEGGSRAVLDFLDTIQ